MSISDKKIAVCHGNRLRKDDGAIRVAYHISRIFDAKLYIGFNKSGDSGIPDDINYEILFDSWKSNIIKKNSMLRDLASMDWWQHNDELYKYDIIIHSGNEPLWFVPKDHQKVIHYCHAPPRVPYENFHEKGDSLITRLYSNAVRTLYLPTIKYPDVHIVPSKTVKKRMKLYWDKSSQVVNPPVDLSDFDPDVSSNEEYYLTFSRLDPAKRIYEVALAFTEMDKNLVIGGTGQQKDKIESIASQNDNIEYVGYMSENEKSRRLSESKALIFNSVDEAFGIVPIESFASGTPLIGVNDGHIPKHIDDGKNGIIYERGEIKNAVDRFEKEGVSMTDDKIAEKADKYSVDTFSKEMISIAEEVISED